MSLKVFQRSYALYRGTIVPLAAVQILYSSFRLVASRVFVTAWAAEVHTGRLQRVTVTRMPLWPALLCIGVLARSVPKCPRCAVVLKRASEGKQKRNGAENAKRSTAIKVPLPSMPTAQKALLVEHLRERQTATTM